MQMIYFKYLCMNIYMYMCIHYCTIQKNNVLVQTHVQGYNYISKFLKIVHLVLNLHISFTYIIGFV